MSIHWLEPNWPTPDGVRALTTLRAGGISQGAYASLNLGSHVGDTDQHVAENRRMLSRQLGLTLEPRWLDQVHGNRIIDAADPTASSEADGAWTNRLDIPCVVMTADCLPILLSNRSGTVIAAVHAGWRGLADGVIEAAVEAMPCGEFMAWLGPAIGPNVFEVGEEVRATFLARSQDSSAAFRPSAQGRWIADIYTLATQTLQRCGVADVYGGGYCTYSDADQFFSYRRDGLTGRMATLIWRQQST